LNKELGIDASLEDWDRFHPLSTMQYGRFVAPEPHPEQTPITSKLECSFEIPFGFLWLA
jgi:hypothetical protein